MDFHLERETPIHEEELHGAQFFHGHKCPAMPQGLRAGHVAMDMLGASRARVGGDLLAILEIGDYHFSACFADGVQYATGCTMGKGNIIKKPMGKFALTLVDGKTRRAARVAMKYERMLMCLTMPFFEQRKQGVMPYDLDPKVVEPLITGALTNDWRQIFDVALFEDYPLTRHGESFNAVQCVGCRELVVREYAVEWQGQQFCQACFDHLVHVHAQPVGSV